MKPVSEWRVLIVGLGQIGGSIGLDLVERTLVAEVIGFDIDNSTRESAVERRAVHRTVEDPIAAAEAADLIILAVPIRKTIEVINSLAESLSEGNCVADVAGIRTGILQTVESLEQPINFVGVHPMAGSEGIGLESAVHGLFEGASLAITPSSKLGTGWLESIMELIGGLGGNPLMLTPDKHDRLVGMASHLPHILGVALMNLALKYQADDDRSFKTIGGSFKSATRVTASSVELMLDMFLTNSIHDRELIEELIAELESLKQQITDSDEPVLRDYLDKAQKARRLL
ncbi:MAG: prephenate dehydrogenase [candidate division Zixibacteria bacterium]|nr:prephenate dehydrogenase [candidate division Zixibacteria bacterium]MDH3936125.1 prephenate dehydrogenase [candidate division Zixibacteria bacterium]MDH4035607.1 prephenate dehydrogenase [candidate division Zixibacteria bacterium]